MGKKRLVVLILAVLALGILGVALFATGQQQIYRSKAASNVQQTSPFKGGGIIPPPKGSPPPTGFKPTISPTPTAPPPVIITPTPTIIGTVSFRYLTYSCRGDASGESYTLFSSILCRDATSWLKDAAGSCYARGVSCDPLNSPANCLQSYTYSAACVFPTTSPIPTVSYITPTNYPIPKLSPTQSYITPTGKL